MLREEGKKKGSEEGSLSFRQRQRANRTLNAASARSFRTDVSLTLKERRADRKTESERENARYLDNKLHVSQCRRGGWSRSVSASLRGLSARYTAGVQMSADTTHPLLHAGLLTCASRRHARLPGGLPVRPLRNKRRAGTCNSC